MNSALVSGRYTHYLLWDANRPLDLNKVPLDPAFAGQLLGPENNTLGECAAAVPCRVVLHVDWAAQLPWRDARGGGARVLETMHVSFD